MKRLAGTDALLLAMETPEWHFHVGGLVLLDPTGVDGFGPDRVTEVLSARAELVPKLQWRLKEVPFGLDRPVWVRDEGFDVRRHVHRVGVPQPGGPVELGELFGQIMSHQLNRKLPLWEYWYVDGLRNGRIAVVFKFHHALLDGVAGASLATLLMDVEPDAPVRREAPADAATAGDVGHTPSDPELVLRALVPNLRTPERLVRYGTGVVRRSLSGLRYVGRHPAAAPPLRVPRTPWNHEISSRRTSAFTWISFDDVRRVARSTGAKVNDVVLGLAAGALRAYLDEHDALPGTSLVASVPISTRRPGDTALDNRLASMMVALHTDVADPVSRLEAIHHSASDAKEMVAQMRRTSIPSLGETFSPLVLHGAFRTLHNSHALEHLPVVANLVVSNVAGPPMPLYLAGARVMGYFPSSVLLDGMGINLTVVSHAGRLDIGVGADPDLVPDPWRIVELVGAALRELMLAVGAGEPTAVEDPFGPASTVTAHATLTG